MTDPNEPELLEHIGWRLHVVFQRWKTLFAQKMVEQGCPWIAEARGELIQHISRKGVGQNVLVERSGLTKQAVQQHLDALAADGVIERVSDPKDARKKRVLFTDKGIDSLHRANAVKREIESEFIELLGKKEFAQLSKALQRLSDPPRAQG
ncbi:MAG: MarR family winged helix-turn-helix transcriptional regulator [Pseudomonadota bacterium]